MVKRAVGCFIVIFVILTGTNIQYTRVIRRICEGLKAVQRVGTCRTAIRLDEVKRVDDDAMRNVAVGSAWRKSARFESAFKDTGRTTGGVLCGSVNRRTLAGRSDILYQRTEGKSCYSAHCSIGCNDAGHCCRESGSWSVKATAGADYALDDWCATCISLFRHMSPNDWGISSRGGIYRNSGANNAALSG